MTNPDDRLERPTFTDFLRANTRGLIDPIVTVLARLRVTPNALTVVGMLGHIPAAWLTAQGNFRLALLIGAAAVLLDALDGSLARKLNAAHNGKGFGAFLDSTLDRIAETILFGGLIVYFGRQGEPLYTLLTYIALTGSILVSYTRARAEALGYACKVGLFSRVERYLVLLICGLANRPDWAVIVLAVGVWITVAQRITAVYRQARDAR